MLRYCRRNPLRLAILLWWLLQGRAYTKERLARRYKVDPAQLPYDQRVLAWLREQHAAGRTIVLATAYDRRAAHTIAQHLGLFDHVFASDGHINLKSQAKARRLRAAFPNGFVYAGNESADLAVWRAAKRAVIVNAAPALERKAASKFEVERVFPREQNHMAAAEASSKGGAHGEEPT